MDVAALPEPAPAAAVSVHAWRLIEVRARSFLQAANCSSNQKLSEPSELREWQPKAFRLKLRAEGFLL